LQILQEENHNIENRWKLQNKKKRNDTSKPNGEIDGSGSVASDNNSDNDDVLLAFVGCASDDALWILDSAYSYHVYINIALFSTYELVQNGCTVWMRDNSSCEVVGMSTVQIKMFDGVVRTLTEVWYVTSMSRNLISLSTMNDVAAPDFETTKIWHMRLGHMSARGMS
jgi:hypothetical protein